MSRSVEKEIQRLKQAIQEVSQRSTRKPEEVQFVLVTKTIDVARIREAFNAGVVDFGENRVQELLKKKKELPENVSWHMIGHLQTNKVKQIVGEVVLIHSLDRLELAQEIHHQAEVKGLGEIDCLIQVNSSGEKTKYGLELNQVESFVSSIRELKIKIRGLMTIAPFTEAEAKIRQSFRSVHDLQEQMKQKFSEDDWGILSMGMSGDYRIAIEEGSTLLRVGSAIFGERNYA